MSINKINDDNLCRMKPDKNCAYCLIMIITIIILNGKKYANPSFCSNFSVKNLMDLITLFYD